MDVWPRPTENKYIGQDPTLLKHRLWMMSMLHLKSAFNSKLIGLIHIITDISNIVNTEVLRQHPRKGRGKVTTWRRVALPWSNTDVILLSRVVKFCKTPINQAKLSQFMVYHYIMRFHISVHYSLRMTVIQCLQKSKEICSLDYCTIWNITYTIPRSCKNNIHYTNNCSIFQKTRGNIWNRI